MTETTTLVKFNAAKYALAEARSIDEVKGIRDKAEALRLYSIQQRESLGMQNDIAEIKIRAERRIGEMIPEMQECGELASQNSGRPKVSDDATLKLNDIGITRDQSSDWQAIAKLPEETFEQHISQTKADGESELTSAGVLRLAKVENRDHHVMDVMGKSDSPEWYTPQHIIDLTVELMGTIELDPCSNSKTKPAVPATYHFTAEDDGLAQDWFGRLYMNPPYGSEIPNWAEKLIQSYEVGMVDEAIALLPGRIDTNWFQPFYKYLMCNVKGRVQFANSPYLAPFPSVIVYLGKNEEQFKAIFSKLGPVMHRVA